MYTLFFLRTGLHASQSRLTDERVFMPRVWEETRSVSGERVMRETVRVDDGKEKNGRREVRNMSAIGREEDLEMDETQIVRRSGKK